MTVGPAPPGAATLASLAQGGPALAALVAARRAQARGGDERLGCAWLIGGIAWDTGLLLAGLALAGWPVSRLDPAALALRPRAVAWREGEAEGVATVLDLALDPAGVARAGDGLDPSTLARVAVALHEGVVAALSAATGLGPAAQWRLVGDGLSGALLERGRAMGRLDEALALGRAILSEPGSRLRAAQAGYVEIAGPRRAGGGPGAWFRLRGGCCRLYTAEGGERCDTCVLRSPADRIARLGAALEAGRRPSG